jgi:hypothetical protein
MRREIVPEGPMKVAQYEVLGCDAKEMSVPPGTIETFGSGRTDFLRPNGAVRSPRAII